MRKSSARQRLEQYQASIENAGRRENRIFIAIVVAFAIAALVVFLVKRTPQGPVDVNRASAAELQKLPNVGPAMARDIVQGRPYQSADDLLKIKGIGPKTLEKLRPLIVVPGK